MKKVLITTALIAFGASTAFADTLNCERVMNFGADATPGEERVFYAHGCDRFQYSPLTPREVANLGEHCNVESSATGRIELVEVEVEVEPDYDYHHVRAERNWEGPKTETILVEVFIDERSPITLRPGPRTARCGVNGEAIPPIQ